MPSSIHKNECKTKMSFTNRLDGSPMKERKRSRENHMEINTLKSEDGEDNSRKNGKTKREPFHTRRF
ncbi:hypothetical protein LIER_20173 [Lithospermum erythrorhizon]|uniref:Uncharacterized protein n=1 Tax=Lithospermum erythrorhizon TaxID=34254 RepID=A0AAV3QLG3_LITER